MPCPFKHDPHFPQILKGESGIFSRRDNFIRSLGADSRDAEELFHARLVDLHGKILHVPKRPGAFGVVFGGEIFSRGRDLLASEAVKAQQPVRLVQPVFAQQPRARIGKKRIAYDGRVTAVGTTSVRTLESLAALGYRIVRDGEPDSERVVGQWEIYDIPDGLDGRELLAALADYMERERLQKIKTSTRIMIMPGYRFRVVNSLITNFHQPQSTLLLLVSAFIGEDWRRAYRYALDNGFRFLSYGDSSLLIR